jgi:hypothetical protein
MFSIFARLTALIEASMLPLFTSLVWWPDTSNRDSNPAEAEAQSQPLGSQSDRQIAFRLA